MKISSLSEGRTVPTVGMLTIVAMDRSQEEEEVHRRVMVARTLMVHHREEDQTDTMVVALIGMMAVFARSLTHVVVHCKRVEVDHNLIVGTSMAPRIRMKHISVAHTL